MSGSRLTLECDDWTIHTLKLHLSGRPPIELIQGIRESLLHPEVYPCRRRDPDTGRRFVWSYGVTVHFSEPKTSRLLSLGEIGALLEASLDEFPWLRDPRLSVSRIDLASDHLVSIPPAELCALIAQINLPYSQRIAGYLEDGDPYNTVYHVSGRRSSEPIPFTHHHRKGKQPIVVVHYPRLEALLARRDQAEVTAAAIEYTRNRLRQEVRFRREAIRRCIGPGAASVGSVLGSLPAFVRAAERRLRPITEHEGILSSPRGDRETRRHYRLLPRHRGGNRRSGPVGRAYRERPAYLSEDQRLGAGTRA